MFKEKELVALVKRNSTGTLIWQRKGAFDYITNRHVAVKLADLGTRYPKVFTQLLVTFKNQMPADGESATLSFGSIGMNTAPDVASIVNAEYIEHGEFTSFLKEIDQDTTMRIYKTGRNGYRGINEDYVKLLDGTNRQISCGRGETPTVCVENTLRERCILLPFRIDHGLNEMELLVEVFA